jgi:hypothetical protein
VTETLPFVFVLTLVAFAVVSCIPDLGSGERGTKVDTTAVFS